MEKHILVDETTDEDSYQLFITMSIKSECYEYVLESQPLYETDGENPDADIDAILLLLLTQKMLQKSLECPVKCHQ